MLKSTQEAVNKEKLNRGGPTKVAGKKKQQQQQSRGADKQLQGKVWDPGGFQHNWRAHEQELMNFSQQWSMMQEHRYHIKRKADVEVKLTPQHFERTKPTLISLVAV
jgi:hypothetical protein